MKKNFLMAMIISLCIGALIGIVIFLFGSFGEIEVKILGTTLIIGGYSLLGLCCSALYEKKHGNIFALLGIISALLGFIWFVGLIWSGYDFIDFDNTLELILTFIIVPVSLAQSSLILLINSDNKMGKMTVWATIFFIIILTLMLLIAVWNIDFDFGDFYFRLLGVVGILDVLGTIVSPILNKVLKLKKVDE
jgi:hypothetical protein